MAPRRLCVFRGPLFDRKGVRIAGLGTKQLRLVEVDENFAMRPDAFGKESSRTGKRGG
jgi:hypothetical protein